MAWDAAVEAVIVMDLADHVHGGEFFEGELGDLALPGVSLGHFGGVHDHDEAALAFDLYDFEFHVDGEGFFDFGVLPAAGAEALVAADHDEPRPLIVNVAANDLLLLRRDAVGRHVGEHHRVELAQESRQPFAVPLGHVALSASGVMRRPFQPPWSPPAADRSSIWWLASIIFLPFFGRSGRSTRIARSPRDMTVTRASLLSTRSPGKPLWTSCRLPASRRAAAPPSLHRRIRGVVLGAGLLEIVRRSGPCRSLTLIEFLSLSSRASLAWRRSRDFAQVASGRRRSADESCE